jgi:ribosome-associated toxin RatA of RatAB toxin-antitoxin module
VLSSRVELINNGSMEKRIREMSELGIGINGMDVKYTSKVTREERINGKELYRILANVDNDDIFHHLRTEWMFKPFLNAEHDRKCLVEFDVRFKFKSPILAQLATTMLEESNKLILDAFERRAREIYQ